MTSYRIQLDPVADGYLIALRRNGKLQFAKKFSCSERMLCLNCLKDLLTGGYKTAPAEILTDLRVPVDPSTMLVANTDVTKLSFCNVGYLKPSYQEFLEGIERRQIIQARYPIPQEDV